MTETRIHPTAVVETGAHIGQGVQIGPLCHVGPDVILGDGVELAGHVSVIGATTIGDGTKVHPYAVLGGPPQDMKHKGGRTTLTVGRNCIIREHVTMHTGTDSGRGATVVGDNGFYLVAAHVAHDCIVGNNVTLTNQATLGGHCEVGDHVIIGGLTAVHQNVRIGRRAFLGGCSAIVGDVIPFAMAVGNRARLQGFNLVGMRRSGMARAQVLTMREAYRRIFDPKQTVARNLEAVALDYADSPEVMEIVDFMTKRGKRHMCVPPYAEAGEAGDGSDG
jgi:UDP-N-acetylglucosamine acyltransferase